jgi:uncharacterized membrane protein HdeD (DUF308 family)
MNESIEVAGGPAESSSDGETPITTPWWTMAVVGGISIAVGIAAMVWPQPTLAIIGVLFGAYLAFWGAIALLNAVAAVDNVSTGLRVVGILIGLLALLTGLVLIVHPGKSVQVVVWVLGFWWCLLGTLQLIRGIVVRQGRVWHLIWGLVVLAAGIVLLADSTIGLKTLVIIVGIALIVQGLIEIALAFAVRSVQSS